MWCKSDVGYLGYRSGGPEEIRNGTYRLPVLGERLIIAREGNEKEDRGHVLKAMNPFPAL